MVKYCNAACKKKHRTKHKKACEHVAELHDEKLFEQPPPVFDDCPICFLRMPALISGSIYMCCCGKIICTGCLYAPVYDNQGNKVTEKLAPKNEKEIIERYVKRMDAGDDALAMYNIANCYSDGDFGLPQNYAKALELWHRAAELGHASAYHNIGSVYNNGRGLEVDK